MTTITNTVPPSSKNIQAVPITSMVESQTSNKYSSLNWLTRVIARCRRLLLIIWKKKESCTVLPHYLTVSELRKAREIILKLSQFDTFKKEIDLLARGNEISISSPLSELNVFLDPTDRHTDITGRWTFKKFSTFIWP